jgi:hypothetical protein
MTHKINTILLAGILIVLTVSLMKSRPSEAGRFQQIDTPAHQIAFDTKTGQRCWVWQDPNEPRNVPAYFSLCSELAKQ